MFLGYQNNKIKFYTNEKLDSKLYNIDKCEETDKDYVLDGDSYVLKDDIWEEKQAKIEIQKKIEEIKSKLNDIDLKSIRPARAGETERLAELELQAVELRKQLSELQEQLNN